MSEHARNHAVAELVALAGDRPDLLAQEAGLSLEFVDAGTDIIPGRSEMQAELCIQAGADRALIGQWRAEGHARAFAASQIPRIW